FLHRHNLTRTTDIRGGPADPRHFRDVPAVAGGGSGLVERRLEGTHELRNRGPVPGPQRLEELARPVTGCHVAERSRRAGDLVGELSALRPDLVRGSGFQVGAEPRQAIGPLPVAARGSLAELGEHRLGILRGHDSRPSRRLTSSARVIGSNGLAMVPTAPSASHSPSRPGVTFAVRNTTGISRVWRSVCSSLRMAGPPSTGIITSSKIASGCVSAATRSASPPLETVVTRQPPTTSNA